jgi:hypothetical protein
MRQPQNLLSFLLTNRRINSLSCVHLSTVGLYTNNMISEPAFEENHRPFASHLQTLSHYVEHSTLIGIRTHNISGDRH